MRKRFAVIALTLLALMLVALLGAARIYSNISKVREARRELCVFQSALDQYRLATGKYPSSLSDLVKAQYFRQVPTDRMTGRNDTWVVEWSKDPTDPGIIRIHSGSPRMRRADTYCDIDRR